MELELKSLELELELKTGIEFLATATIPREHLLGNQPFPNFSFNRGGHDHSCDWLLMQQVCLSSWDNAPLWCGHKRPWGGYPPHVPCYYIYNQFRGRLQQVISGVEVGFEISGIGIRIEILGIGIKTYFEYWNWNWIEKMELTPTLAVDKPKVMGSPPDHPWTWWKTVSPKSFTCCLNYFYLSLVINTKLHVFHLIMFSLIENWVVLRVTLGVMLDRPIAQWVAFGDRATAYAQHCPHLPCLNAKFEAIPSMLSKDQG